MFTENCQHKLVANAKLMIGPAAVLAEKWVVHNGSIVWARGQAFARGIESDGFQKALGAVVKTEGDLQAYFGFKTWEQLAMRGGQAILLGFAVYAENRQLPTNLHLDKMPKPVKYVAETARALYFASLMAAPVILDRIIKGEPVEPVSAGLVLGTAGAGLLYSGLRVAAANDFAARERRKENLHNGKVDLNVDDWKFNSKTEELMKNLKKGRDEAEVKNAAIVQAAKAVDSSREAEAFQWAAEEAPVIVPIDLLPAIKIKPLMVRIAKFREEKWRRNQHKKQKRAGLEG